MFDLTALDDFKLVVMAGEGKAVLARFQNGRLTKTDAVAVRREVTLQGGKTKFLYDMAGDSGLNYIGEPCEGASEEWSVVIRDKATGEIQMLEAEAVLFRPNTSAFTSPQKLDMA